MAIPDLSDWTLKQIVEQLEFCEYECEAGTLKTNVAFIELKRRAEREANHDVRDQ